jgi:rubrerythrin
MVVYTCGNYEEDDNPPETCPFCDAEEREQTEREKRFKTVSVTCPGWYPDE